MNVFHVEHECPLYVTKRAGSPLAARAAFKMPKDEIALAARGESLFFTVWYLQAAQRAKK